MTTSTDLAAALTAAQKAVSDANTYVTASKNTSTYWYAIQQLFDDTATLDAIQTAIANLSVPTGPTGATGPSGPTGASGPTGTATGPTGTTPAALIQGFYTGSNTVAAITALASKIGVSVNGYSFYTDGSSWASIAGYKPPSLPAGATLLLGVDLTPNNTGLSAVAANVSSFVKLAKTLIGTPTIVRLGWEFDGSWMPWGTGANGNTAAQYNPAVSLVIPAMRAANPALQFDFCCNSGTSTLAQLEVYYGSNGDTLWDLIGGDHYDLKGGGGNTSQLNAALALAQARKKRFSIGEWGLNGGPDAAGVKFINLMAAFIKNPANNVGYHSYFSDDLAINSDITQFPNSMAAYKAAGL